MKFGIFYELSVPRPWDREAERTVYLNGLEQVRLADELGFAYVWAVEHHFLEEYSHCSTLLPPLPLKRRPRLFPEAVRLPGLLPGRRGGC